MAHHVEPMDVDCMDSDFDKENTYHHTNVLPSTEKGYEELDVSELNMKLRYSMTPASSPMSKSYAACLDSKNLGEDDCLNYNTENSNLTQSLNSTITKNDSVIKSSKSLPLQALPTHEFLDGNENSSLLRQFDSTITSNTIAVTVQNDKDEFASFPSSSSSTLHTPEATTPTKDLAKDGDSPIMRGLKSVFNMFRSSQSPIPSMDTDHAVKQHTPSTPDTLLTKNTNMVVLASTPISTQKSKDGINSKRSSPYKDCLVFNDDLEKELNWKDETTILFSEEKIPVHKLFFQHPKSTVENKPSETGKNTDLCKDDYFDSTVEYMDISADESVIIDRTVTKLQLDKKCKLNATAESDSEFVDCESIFSKNEPQIIESNETGSDTLVAMNSNNISLTQNIYIDPIAKPTVDSGITALLSSERKIRKDATQSHNADYSKDTIEILSELEMFDGDGLSKSESQHVIVDLQKNMLNKNEDINKQNVACNITTIGVEEENKIEHCIKAPESQSTQLYVTEEIFKHDKNISSIASPVLDELQNQNMQSNVDFNNKVTEFEALPQIILNQDNTDVAVTSLTVHINTQFPETDTVLEDINVTSLNRTQTHDMYNNSSSFCIDNPVIAGEEFDAINSRNINVICPENTSIQKSEMPVKATPSFAEELSDETTVFSEMYVTDVKNTSETKTAPEALNPSDIPFEKNKSSGRLHTVLADTEPIKPFVTTKVRTHHTTLGITPEFQRNTISEVINTTIEKEYKGPANNDSQIDVSKLNKIIEHIPDTLIGNDPVFDIALEDLSKVLVKDVIGNESTSLLENEYQEPANIEIDITEKHKLIECVPNVQDFNGTELEIASEDLSKKIVKGETVKESLLLLEKEYEGHRNIKFEINMTEIKKSRESILDLPNKDSKEGVLDIQNMNTTEFVVNVDPSKILVHSNIGDESLPVLEKEYQDPQNIHSETKITELISNKSVQFIPGVQVEMAETSTNSCVVSSFDTIPDHFGDDKVTFVDKPITNTLDYTAKDKLNCNESLEIKPMDITINKNLNQPLSLPDIVNQTIDIYIKNITNITTSNGTDDFIPNQDEINVNIGHVKLIGSDVEIPLETENGNTSSTVYSNSPNLLNSSDIVQQFEKLENEKQNMITNNELSNVNLETNIENIQYDSIKLENKYPTEHVRNAETVDSTNVEVAYFKEDLVVSESNTLRVPLCEDIKTIADDVKECFEKIQNAVVSNTCISLSPPITSKGYNFNFDENDDPFATKTKMRISPPLNTPTKLTQENVDIKQFVVPKKIAGNRRKSQCSERKRQTLIQNKFNKTFDVTIKSIEDETMANTEISHEASETKGEIVSIEISKDLATAQKVHKGEENDMKTVERNEISPCVLENSPDSSEIKVLLDSMSNKSNETKSVSSLEQSVYYSAGASSAESSQSKNVFNLPEIDDINFNPFATKSKMRQSSSSDLEVENSIIANDKINSLRDNTIILDPHIDSNTTIIISNVVQTNSTEIIASDDKMETEFIKKGTSALSITSSKSTDVHNLTICDVHTEDEDTIEGPFLEVDGPADTISEVDSADMMQFHDMPADGANDNLGEGELFIDAEAYEFLLNQNPRNFVTDSGKESLFLKFDPLFANKISSDGVLAALSNDEKEQTSPTKSIPTSINQASSLPGPSNYNITFEGEINISQESNDDANITVAKPMLAVSPAVNPAITPRQKSITPSRSNRRSITFTSPAIAVIDRLLSMSANNSFLEPDTISQTNREQAEADIALSQLRELLAEKETNVYNLKCESRELKDRLANMETQLRILDADRQERLNKINELNENLIEKTRINKSMAAVVEEYERTIASLIAEIEHDKKRNAEERNKLIYERDEQTAHLASMEVSFNDLHSKYEKSKQVIHACKANEESYKTTIKKIQENIKKMQTNYEMLKNHATSKLHHSNQEFEKMGKTHETEVLKLNAMIKRKCLLITSLEETLAQKTKANEELTAICDELLTKVG